MLIIFTYDVIKKQCETYDIAFACVHIHEVVSFFTDKTNTGQYFTINDSDGTITQTQTIDLESLNSATFTIDITVSIYGKEAF